MLYDAIEAYMKKRIIIVEDDQDLEWSEYLDYKTLDEGSELYSSGSVSNYKETEYEIKAIVDNKYQVVLTSNIDGLKQRIVRGQK